MNKKIQNIFKINNINSKSISDSVQLNTQYKRSQNQSFKLFRKFSYLSKQKNNLINSIKNIHLSSSQRINTKINKNNSLLSNQIQNKPNIRNAPLINSEVKMTMHNNLQQSNQMYMSHTMDLIGENTKNKIKLKSNGTQIKQLKKQQKIKKLKKQIHSTTKNFIQNLDQNSDTAKSNFKQRLIHAKSQLKLKETQIKKSLDKSIKSNFQQLRIYNNLYPLTKEQTQLRKNILANNRWYKSLIKICKIYKLERYEDKVVKSYFNNKPPNTIQQGKSIQVYYNKQRMMRREMLEVPVLKMKF